MKMNSYDTRVVFACRLCKASFQIVDDFIAHKKEEHSVEFRTSNCIVFEDVLILNRCNDKDDDDKKCGAPSAVKERDSTSTVPWKENPNLPVIFGIENSLTDVDSPDLSHRTLAESFDQLPILTAGDYENGDSHDNNTCVRDDNKAHGNFLQENVDDHESTNSSQAPADPIFNFIEPKTELTEFEFKTNRDEISKTDSVELIPLPLNPYVFLKKLSSQEIQNYSSRIQNRETHQAAEVTSNSKYQCRLCLKKFNSEADLDSHCSVCILDDSSRVWYCVPCKKFFSSQRDQNMHQIRHHGADGEQLNLLKFKCGVCLKPYSRKDVLRNHMKSHKETNEQNKPFKCDTCSASFFAKYDFRRHKASHSSTRPFQFPEPYCRKSFKLNIHLSKHLKYVHANRVKYFNCPEPNCTTVFKHKSSFEKHFRTFHTFHEKMP